MLTTCSCCTFPPKDGMCSLKQHTVLRTQKYLYIFPPSWPFTPHIPPTANGGAESMSPTRPFAALLIGSWGFEFDGQPDSLHTGRLGKCKHLCRFKNGHILWVRIFWKPIITTASIQLVLGRLILLVLCLQSLNVISQRPFFSRSVTNWQQPA